MQRRAQILTAAATAALFLVPLQTAQAQTPTSTAAIPVLDRLVSLQADSISAADLSAALAQTLGVPVEIRLPKENDTVSMQIVDAPMRDVFAILGQYGAVLVGGEPVAAPTRGHVAEPLDRTLSLNVKNADAAIVIDQLADFTGLSLNFIPTQAGSRVSLDVKGATVREVLQMLANFGTLEVNGERFSSGS